MREFLKRIFRPDRRRAFEAAAAGRRWDGLKADGNLNAATFAGGAVLRKRAAHFVLNNPWIAQAVGSKVANLIGTGIKPQSQHPDLQVREGINALWARWTGDADAAGLTSFGGLQAQIARAMILDGEGFARFRIRRPEDGLSVPLQLQMLAAEQVDQSLHRNLDGDRRIRAGIEFDALGRRVAFHTFSQHPGDPLPVTLRPQRIPASEIMHVFPPLAAGQVRGVSGLAPVLLRLHELDQYEDATAVAQKVRALFAGFITDAAGDGAGFGADAGKEIIEHGLEPGTLRVLPPGTDITFSEPATGGDSYADFVKVQLRAIAAGLGVTYEQLTGDMTGVNFSSARVALIEFRRRIEALQEQVIVHQFCKPTWERFVRIAVLSGALPAPGFERDPRPWLAVKWMPPGWDWVDPLKDIKADALAVANHFKSRSEVIAARGWDPEMIDAEIAGDQKRADRLGLSPVTAPAAAQPEERDDANT